MQFHLAAVGGTARATVPRGRPQIYHDVCSQPPYATSSGLSGPPTIPTAHAIPPAKQGCLSHA